MQRTKHGQDGASPLISVLSGPGADRRMRQTANAARARPATSCRVAVAAMVVLAESVACQTWRDAANAADKACLASVMEHVRPMQIQGEAAEWRDWRADELDELVKRLPAGLDCQGGLRRGPDLRRELRARTHLKSGRVEAEFWLASRPNVRCCLD